MFTLLQASTEVVAQEVVATQELNFSLWSMAVKGGWLMLVLLALSIVAIYIFGQKWWAIRKAANIDKNFMNEIRNLIHEGKINAALEMCKNDNSPIARLVEKGIERIGHPGCSREYRQCRGGKTGEEPPYPRHYLGRRTYDRFPGYCSRYDPGLLQYVTGRKQHRHHPPFRLYLHCDGNHSRRSFRRYHRILRIQLPDIQDL